MKEINKKALIAEIQTGLYNKKLLAEKIGIAEGTLNKFLKSEEGKEVEDLRQSKRPNLKVNGRKEYLKEFNAKYKRPITPERQEWVRNYERERRAKRKAEREAQKVLLVPPEKVKVSKAVDKTGFTDSIAPNQIVLNL